MANKDTFRPYYQRFAESGQISELPDEWESLDYSSFSEEKTLYDFQQEALEHGLKFLHHYVEYERSLDGVNEAKRSLVDDIQTFAGDIVDSKELRLRKRDFDSTFEKLRERYSVENRTRYGYDYEEIDFYNFANRMGFWMATGSGKTLVAIKLIELINRLSKRGEIPDRDILLLTHRDDILEQFREEIQEYNAAQDHTIRVWDVRDYSDVKVGNRITSQNTINVFTYRSDLITDETSENELNFEDIENNGEWYLLLDEAHKGQASISKHQAFFSTLTRNGFLFNFSATFTDPLDILTTTYNYNIERFTREGGFGKNILLSDQSLSGITDEDFDESEKRKTVLKSLIAITAQIQARDRIGHQYHNPLLTAFVNSVNTTDSDLELFFRELEKIANTHRPEAFKNARGDLKSELIETEEYAFSDEAPDWAPLDDIEKKDVLKHVYNSETHSAIEVRHSSENEKELIFKLKTSTQPFALMKIGTTSTWLQEKLEGYDVEEQYDLESYFDNLNDSDSTINILLGSRSFYEGWDSNRPNVMLFINLGKSNRRKFIMQAIGRGMRIEPVPNKRRRIRYLPDVDEIKGELEDIKTIETLLIFGTSVDSLEEITSTIVEMRDTSLQNVEGIEVDDEVSGDQLFVPTYQEKEADSIDSLSQFDGNKETLSDFLEWLDDRRFLLPITNGLKYDSLQKMEQFIENGELSGESYPPQQMVADLQRHVNSGVYEREGFGSVTDRIIHFKDIKGDFDSEDDKKELESLIEQVKQDAVTEDVEKLREQFEAGELTTEEFTERVAEAGSGTTKERFDKYSLIIENLSGHFYYPVLYSDGPEAASRFQKIIDVDSEVSFINKLSRYLDSDDLFPQSKWWRFSKISEQVDEVYIPYDNNQKFKPDFIFWINSDNSNRYDIIFVDPKSTEFTEHQRKIDGYEEIFVDEETDSPKEFNMNGKTIRVWLKLFTETPLGRVPKGYRNYWENDIADIVPAAISETSSD